MAQSASILNDMTLFTPVGERKYLTLAESARFLDALPVLDNAADRTFCEMIYWTGCRPSEALALTALSVDLEEQWVMIRSLKKRGRLKGRHFRPVPVPEEFMTRLDAVHGIRRAHTQPDRGENVRLWPMGRTTAWERVQTVMRAAGIHGERASAKGLRHAYGVHSALIKAPESRIQKWLGHASRATTDVYLDMDGPEDRAIAARMWQARIDAGPG